MGEDWARLAASSDVEERRKAALSLLEEPSPAALPLLPELLGDANWRVRKAAVEVALAQPPNDVIPLLLEGLHDAENAGRRNTSLETLVKLGQAVLPYAYEALVEEDPDVKLALILLLGEIPGKGSVPHLIYYLSHENKNIVCAAITSLGKLRDSGNLPVLFDLMARGDDWVLFHIVDALADTGGPVGAQKLMELYDTARFQKAILKALGKMGDPAVIPFLLERALESKTHIPELMNTIGLIHNASMPEAFLLRHQSEIARILRDHFPLPLIEKLENIWPESKIPERRGMLLVAGSLTDLTLLPRVLDELDNPYLQRDAFQAASRYGSAAVPHLIRRLNATSSSYSSWRPRVPGKRSSLSWLMLARTTFKFIRRPWRRWGKWKTRVRSTSSWTRSARKTLLTRKRPSHPFVRFAAAGPTYASRQPPRDKA